MEQESNIIITISGEPSSGKTTALRNLEIEFRKMGFEVETMLVGKRGRVIILDAYKAYLERHPEKRKSSKITVEDAHADKEFCSIIRKELDALIDFDTEQYGKKINSEYTPNILRMIDGRLAFLYIPNSFKVRLIIDPIVAGKRAYEDKSRGFESIEEATLATIERRNGELGRYMERNQIDLSDVSQYHAVIDTTYLSEQEVVQKIIDALILYMEKNGYVNKLLKKPTRENEDYDR